MSDFDEVLFAKRSGIGFITLNRPKALNSLTATMAAAIRDQLTSWNRDRDITAVVVTGAGEKAFCAGGDVVRVVQSYKDGTDEWQSFFHDEYQMNVAIAEFSKPYISFVDGIAMGGGVGVSIPGDFWVASEKTLFAMPETALGLFPDVGGSWFLPRLGGEMGMFLALTGARMKAPDLYAVGIASHHIPSDSTERAIDALMAAEIRDNDDVAAVLNQFHVDPDTAPLAMVMDKIDDHFDYDTVEAITESLSQDPDEWCQKQVSIMARHSPTSMKLTLQQLRRGQALDSFREVMTMEYRMVNRVAAGHDFAEGVRAILIDKDNSPQWQPKHLDEISDADIEAYFAPMPGAELDF